MGYAATYCTAEPLGAVAVHLINTTFHCVTPGTINILQRHTDAYP